MQVLFFALISEAKPWINFLNAKPLPSTGRFRKFQSDDSYIVVSGVGKISMALAVSEFAHSFQKKERSEFRVWNLGIAGSTSKEQSLGDFFWINKIKDFSSGKEYFPERLEKSKLINETHLTTFDKPVSNKTKKYPFSFLEPQQTNFIALADMEASGFFEAATTYFPSENIQVGKIVSDHLEGTFCTEDSVSLYLNNYIPALSEEWQKPIPWTRDDSNFSTKWEELKQIAIDLKITESMLHELKRYLRYFILTNPNEPIPLPELPISGKIKDKTQLKQIFQNWKTKFYV
ncbi:phosphorylase [Leptospira sp. 96542]|nr:phosphorylase [Leptospira sp. 96542]